MGDELAAVLKSIDDGTAFVGTGKTKMGMGVHVLPHITKDTTDRNRTSPFAFTGNKFEFRMPGSSLSVADPNIILNTAVAESLSRIYDALKDVAAEDLDAEIHKLLKKILDEHKRILFNGNGYTDEWIAEAEKRGLANLKSLPDAMPKLLDSTNVELFTKHKIFTKEEIESRYEIFLENYSKTVHIEALTMEEMVRKDFTSGLLGYMKDLTEESTQKKALLGDEGGAYETGILKKLDGLSGEIGSALAKLTEDTAKAEKREGLEGARYYHDVILTDMENLRSYVDSAEIYVPEKYLPYPTYGELLFSLR